MNYSIIVDNLVKSYGDKTVVKGISFKVKENTIFGFLGPNGAGKTTTIRMMIGEIPPDSGNIEISGLKVPDDLSKLKQIMGVVPDYQNIYDRLTIRQNLEFFASLNSVDFNEIDRILDDVFLTEHQNKACKDLSRGLRQRTLIARALLHKPKVFFLDEPTSALDPMSAKLIRDLVLRLRDNGTTVFITTHYMEEADILCDKIAIMNQGTIVAFGSPQELKDKIGRKAVVYEYNQSGELQTVEFSLATKEGREMLAKAIVEHTPTKIHTQEATLEEVFFNVTGNKWFEHKEEHQ